jgi:hypothetical protein
VPDLIVIFGPPAVGKAAVGHELTRLTGFRFFHNHMTAEPVAALFGWGAAPWLLSQLRMTLFTAALAQPNMPSIIFTFVWALDLADDGEFIAIQSFGVRAAHRRALVLQQCKHLERFAYQCMVPCQSD